MKPKWHFILYASLAALGSIIVVLALMYLISFIVFVLHQSGLWFIPSFGREGWYTLLTSLPWLLILLVFLFLGVLEILVRRYAFAYRQPLLYSIVGITILVLVGGWAVTLTPLHGRFSAFAHHRGLPVADFWYRSFEGGHPPSVHRGTIAKLTTSGFILENREGELVVVAITPRTHLPLGAEFTTGTNVVVFGNRQNKILKAFGVKNIEK